MNTLFFRTAILLVHILLNFIVVSWFLKFDISGSWVSIVVFIIGLIVLMWVFIRHIISYLSFIKLNRK